MIQSRSNLKSYFKAKDKPTESQFADLIDSLQHRTEDGSIVSLTRTSAMSNAISGELQLGMTYYLTDKKIWLTALTSSQFSTQGHMIWDVAAKAQGFLTIGGEGDINNITINDVEICGNVIFNTDVNTTLVDVVGNINAGTSTHDYRAWSIMHTLCIEHTGGDSGNGDIVIDTDLDVAINSGMVGGAAAINMILECVYSIDFQSELLSKMPDIPDEYLILFPEDLILAVSSKTSSIDISYDLLSVVLTNLYHGVMLDIKTIPLMKLFDVSFKNVFIKNAVFTDQIAESSNVSNLFIDNSVFNSVIFTNSQMLSHDLVWIYNILSITVAPVIYNSNLISMLHFANMILYAHPSCVPFLNVEFNYVSINNIALYGTGMYESCKLNNISIGSGDHEDLVVVENKIIHQLIDYKTGRFQIDLMLNSTTGKGAVGNVLITLLPLGVCVSDVIIDCGELTSSVGSISIGLDQDGDSNCVMHSTLVSELSDKITKVSAESLKKAESNYTKLIMVVEDANVTGNITLIGNFTL